MKKIIFVILTTLIVCMFIGCASTSGVVNTSKTFNKSNKTPFNGAYDNRISDVYDDVYWKENPRGGDARLAINDGKILSLRKPSDPDRDIRIQNTFNELVNSFKISGRDFMKIYGCHQFMKTQSDFGSKIPFFTLRDFLDEKEIDGEIPFTGKIINNTDKTLKLFFYFARTEDKKFFYIEVSPHEERKFKIIRNGDIDESAFSISDNVNGLRRTLTWIGRENPENKYGESASGIEYDLQAKYARYIFDNYSFEMTFDEETYDDNLNSWVLNWNYWTLVPHYEVDEPALTNPLNSEEVKQHFNMRF